MKVEDFNSNERFDNSGSHDDNNNMHKLLTRESNWEIAKGKLFGIESKKWLLAYSVQDKIINFIAKDKDALQVILGKAICTYDIVCSVKVSDITSDFIIGCIKSINIPELKILSGDTVNTFYGDLKISYIDDKTIEISSIKLREEKVDEKSIDKENPEKYSNGEALLVVSKENII